VAKPKVVVKAYWIIENEVVEVLLLVDTRVVDKLAVHPIFRVLSPQTFTARFVDGVSG
jgi:hypothetical protein